MSWLLRGGMGWAIAMLWLVGGLRVRGKRLTKAELVLCGNAIALLPKTTAALSLRPASAAIALSAD